MFCFKLKRCISVLPLVSKEISLAEERLRTTTSMDTAECFAEKLFINQLPSRVMCLFLIIHATYVKASAMMEDSAIREEGTKESVQSSVGQFSILFPESSKPAEYVLRPRPRTDEATAQSQYRADQKSLL